MAFHRSQIMGFILLIIGGILTLLLFDTMWHDIPIWFLGHKVPATVQDLSYELYEGDDFIKLNTNNYEDSIYIEYFAEYDFTSLDGEFWTGHSRITGDQYWKFNPGREVVIKYSPFDPSINRLDDARFVPFLLFTYIPFILICLFILAAGRELITM